MIFILPYEQLQVEGSIPAIGSKEKPPRKKYLPPGVFLCTRHTRFEPLASGKVKYIVFKLTKIG